MNTKSMNITTILMTTNTKNSKSKNIIKNYKTVIIVALFIISVSLIIYLCLQNYQKFFDFIHTVISILQPIIYGIVLAYLMSPICNFLYDKLEISFSKRLSKEKSEKYSHVLSVALSVVILICIILLFLLLILPQLISSITGFINQLPQHINTLEKFTNNVVDYINFNLPSEMKSNINNYIDMFTRYITNILPNFSSLLNDFSNYLYNFALTIFNFIIGIIVTAYCLDKKTVFSLQFKKILFAFFSKETAITIIDKFHEANEIFLGFLVGKLIDSLIIGIICFFGVLLMRMPYPILISVIIGVTNIIPFFGPFLGAIPCSIIILLENPIQCVYFLIFIFLLQQFDGNILGPKILGDTTGVTSFWVLFSILLFGGLWGIVGMVIGVPLFALIYNFIKEVIDNKLKKKDLPIAAYKYSNPEKIIESEPKGDD